ncbi:hypothetical protein ONS96_001825 [Cadophora gregata f. sp. sojae]|nr:hypothetical protein ONS96_001825 [Cadophora gregata f. sp. sojae]
MPITLADDNNVVFEPNRTDNLSPACGDILGAQCSLNLGTDLVSSAIELAKEPANQATTCSSIASAVQSNFPSSCTIASPQVHGFPLTGAGAAEPLSSSENSTSNCHPTILRSNQLTRVASYKISASVYYNETAPATLGETPVMSLFLMQDGTNLSTIESPSVNFQCLFASAMTTVGNNTMTNNGTDDDTSGAGKRLGATFGILSTVALAAVVFASVIF